MLADQYQGVGDAIERDRQAATIPAEHLLVMIELFAVLFKCGHASLPLRGAKRRCDLAGCTSGTVLSQQTLRYFLGNP
jgi:hypothetical protein